MLNNQIINWYHLNKRDLPWRKTKDPYLIWISEIMLQQTRVATAIDYFDKFTKRFPTITDLALANEQEVLNLWQGLGYYSRARNLHQAAKTILDTYNGTFPNTYQNILSLKGIGTYTAAAVSSFAFNLPYAVLDGNVFRVLSRLFGIDTAIDTGKGKKLFQNLATETMGNAVPELYNQAIIEFGALQCTPKSPKCEDCPLQASCFAYNNNQVENFPRKSKQIKVKNRYFYYLLISYSNRFIIEKREGKDIWKNLYQFPLIECEKECRLEELMNKEEWRFFFNQSDLVIQSISNPVIHKLTHQHITARFIHIKTKTDKFAAQARFIVIEKEDFEKYPFPKLIENQIVKLDN